MRTTLTVILLSMSLTANIFLAARLNSTKQKSPQDSLKSGLQTDISDWDSFITALAWVESRWDDTAESPKKAVGYLQITPILVEDANRIEGCDVFTLEGCTDRKESIRLFNVIMDNYNPQHDMHLALKIWNPYSKVSYHRAVMNKYQELINRNLI